MQAGALSRTLPIIRSRVLRGLLAFMALTAPLGVQAQSGVTLASLPEPLRLVDALLAVSETHPHLQMAHTQVAAAQIRLEQVESSYGLDAFVELQPRFASKASVSGVDFEDDSRYGLVLSKRLMDFGRSESEKEAASAALKAQQVAFLVRRDRLTLNIMERFFAVILADYTYRLFDERLAISYFRYIRMAERRDRFEQYSDLEVAEHEALYRKAYAARLQADLRRRQTRHVLALALGRPGELSKELVTPDLAVYRDRELPPYTELADQVISKSPALQARRQDVAAAQAAVDVAQKLNSPVLSAEFEAREYSNTASASRDRYRANLKFNVPLFNGTGQRDTEVALARNTLLHEQAELLSAEYAVREKVLALLVGLEINRAQALAASAQETYRSYYQDRSRALYELEMRSDLGDAQAAAAEAMLEVIRVDFQHALLWAQIDALLGLPTALIQEN